MPDLEMWGGVECTVARVGDRFRNQVIETGHQGRLDDLDRIASLGIRTVRYPLVWETVAPDRAEMCDWRWHDERLRRLNDLGIRVIAGLMHHGSGPRYTNLLDPEFPSLLAAHAAKAAQRYPWIELFTPVNEPLTTARLSGLYGHWYPHARDERSFLRALVNQCRAIALAMKAIRVITPSAMLVQTEDVGKTFSTPRLSYQADFENARRWLSFDVLCGRFGRDHMLYPFLLAHGIEAAELDAFCLQPSTPDIIGVNHYLTSERYLHSGVSAFPAEFAGGNGRDRYADVEAVRMPVPATDIGPEARLTEVWERYRLPIAITEVHHGCTRDEQLRWLMEVWNAAVRLRRNGADVRAVTSWSLFGAVDWNSLLTRENGSYEPGAFDVRNSPPRLTAIGQAVRSLALHGDFTHPVLVGSPGWWHRPERFYEQKRRQLSPTPPLSRPCLVALGDEGSGWLEACARAASVRGLAYAVVAAGKLDGKEPDRLASVLRDLHPWAIIDTRQYLPGPAQMDQRRALSLACRRLGVQLALIRDETRSEPTHYDPARSRDGALTVPESLGPAAQPKASGEDDLVVCGGPDAVDVVIDLLIDRERGLWKPTHGTLSSEIELRSCRL